MSQSNREDTTVRIISIWGITVASLTLCFVIFTVAKCEGDRLKAWNAQTPYHWQFNPLGVKEPAKEKP